MKHHKSKILLSLLFFSLLGYSANDFDVNFKKLIVARFYNLWQKSPQEKTYLQTDKPYYNAGEDIWFKGYLVNAASNIPNSLSRFLYVELIDKSDSVIYRVKIKRDSLSFAGIIKLNPQIQPGFYSLRAYTYWMQNVSTDFFFRKNIFIGNSIDDRVSSRISYGKPFKNNLPVYIVFENTFGTPYSDKNVIVELHGKGITPKSATITTNKDGRINWQIPNDSDKFSDMTIDVSINEPGLKYRKKFYVPDFRNDFDVQFFPESGLLLNGVLQIVGFKAVGINGLSVNVTGEIYNQNNEEMVEFSSVNKGMGKFVLVAKENERYYAKVKTANGLEKTFNLPENKSYGVGIHLVNNRGRIIYNIFNNTEKPDSSYFLLIHARGIPFVMQRITKINGQIPESAFPSGIVTFSIIDSLQNTYCERLVFVQNSDQPEINMISDKNVYGKRDAVNLNFTIKSLTGKTVDGDYSVSVTDSKTVVSDSLQDNILSYLLLSSDIKGYIEEPGSYFTSKKDVAAEKLDILMLTQGWRRFNTADIVKGKFPKLNYYLEAGQALSGKVLNLFNKPSKDCDIIMFSNYNRMFRISGTDSVGRFLIDGIEFPDSTSFVLKAKKKHSITDVEIIPDKDVFPESQVFIPYRNEDVKPINEYFQQSKEKYYNEGGMLVVNLNEVTVNGDKKTNKNPEQFYAGMADNELNAEKLEQYAGMNILDVIGMMPGVQVNGDQISIRGSKGNPLFLVDGFQTDNMDDVTYLNMSDVENISLFKGANTAIFGSRGGNGVIAIEMKKGYVRKTETPISMASIQPLGYQKPSEFYVPKYEIDSIRLLRKPDLRTTIYWNPKLVADSTGTVHVKFYTADKLDNYRVTFEGVTAKGEICRYVGYLKRENK